MRISPPRSFLARTLLGFILLMMGLFGCGRRGAPVAPRPAIPTAVNALRAELLDSAILVTWNSPSQNEDGSPLTNLREFRLFRAVGPSAPPEARGRPVFSLLATVRAEQPDNAVVQGNQYAFRDDGGQAGFTNGQRYTYQLQAVNRRGRVGAQSAEVFVDFTLAPPPPVALTAVAGDGVINLSWKPPEGPFPEGAPSPRGYNIYRGLESGAYGPQPINAGPIVETQFRDTAVQNETTYYYMVRSAGGVRPPWRESANSNEVSATPIDLTPPSPPQNLTAIPAPGIVSLSWVANTEPDILGYLVYRRELPAVTPVRLTDSPVQTTTFTDRGVRSGGNYAYTITAVDRSSRRNESAPSAEVYVTLP
ncbi:MAG TPA: hypothetical protein VN203_17800 [Candidatus Acidoferrum sp.]|nr:hypothetical protein [Candidatus Acidoferrum sp.]